MAVNLAVKAGDFIGIHFTLSYWKSTVPHATGKYKINIRLSLDFHKTFPFLLKDLYKKNKLKLIKPNS